VIWLRKYEKAGEMLSLGVNLAIVFDERFFEHKKKAVTQRKRRVSQSKIK